MMRLNMQANFSKFTEHLGICNLCCCISNTYTSFFLTAILVRFLSLCISAIYECPKESSYSTVRVDNNSLRYFK